jgi:hypothetical protein
MPKVSSHINKLGTMFKAQEKLSRFGFLDDTIDSTKLENMFRLRLDATADEGLREFQKLVGIGDGSRRSLEFRRTLARTVQEIAVDKNVLSQMGTGFSLFPGIGLFLLPGAAGTAAAVAGLAASAPVLTKPIIKFGTQAQGAVRSAAPAIEQGARRAITGSIPSFGSVADEIESRNQSERIRSKIEQ